MGIFVIYTVARIIISSCFQFSSNKNMGSVILFALQINHLDPLLNIFINPKSCGRPRTSVSRAAAPPAHREAARRRGAIPEEGAPLPRPGALRPVSRPRVLGRSGAHGSFVFPNLSGLTRSAAPLRILFNRESLSGGPLRSQLGRELKGSRGSRGLRQHPASVWGSRDDGGPWVWSEGRPEGPL